MGTYIDDVIREIEKTIVPLVIEINKDRKDMYKITKITLHEGSLRGVEIGIPYVMKSLV